LAKINFGYPKVSFISISHHFRSILGHQVNWKIVHKYMIYYNVFHIKIGKIIYQHLQLTQKKMCYGIGNCIWKGCRTKTIWWHHQCLFKEQTTNSMRIYVFSSQIVCLLPSEVLLE
jgi:hypothetical protein